MVRTFTVESDTDPKALRAAVLDGRIGEDRAATALAQIAELNPHIGESTRIAAGTVLFLPDAPAIKDSAGGSVSTPPWEDFKRQFGGAVERTVRSAEARVEARSAQRTELKTLLGRAEVKRALGADKELTQQAKETARVIDAQEKEDREAAARLAATAEAAKAMLDRLTGLIR